ncbi:PilW family protein [Neisseria sp. S1]|uniref:PilW family protein n=1 Tax=Neisseria sp. S1 TaxID=3318354 RepID=UPI003A88C3DC
MINIKKTRHITAARARQKGFSLIEFLVASILSMIVLIAVGSGYFASRKINDVALARLSVQQDLRNAANLIVRDARMAGGFGCFNMLNHKADAIKNDGATDGNVIFKLQPTDASQTALIPIKQASLGIPGLTGDALIFQYGIGSASVSENAAGGLRLNIPANDPLQGLSNNTSMPLVVSSCNVLDRPTTVTFSQNQLTTDPAISPNHVPAEMAVQRYMVNAYAIGAIDTIGEVQQGLFRYELNNRGEWGNPQFLMSGIRSMAIRYGYLVCPNNAAGAAAGTAASETYQFSTQLRTDMAPALIRITLNGGSIAAGSGNVDGGNVDIYTIDAAVRGGMTCEDNI